jgi:hypothetical protein
MSTAADLLRVLGATPEEGAVTLHGQLTITTHDPTGSDPPGLVAVLHFGTADRRTVRLYLLESPGAWTLRGEGRDGTLIASEGLPRVEGLP